MIEQRNKKIKRLEDGKNNWEVFYKYRK
jgi:hypothetical protein